MVADNSTFHAAAGVSAATSLLRAEQFDVGRSERVTISLLDTFDGRLAAAGLRLTATTTSAATSGDDGGDAVRLVLSSDGPDASAIVGAIPATAADLPPGPLRARIGRRLDVRVLLPVVVIEATRRAAAKRNRTDKTTVTATVYADLVTAGERLDGTYVDISELAGYPGPAEKTRAAVAGAGFSPTGKDLVELAAASAGVDLAGREISPGVPLRGDDDTIDGFRAVLVNLRDAAVATYDGTIDHIDPEFLHDFRVAVRRTRAMLSNAKRVIPADVLEPTRADFAWLGLITGPSRDLDVYQIEWPTYVVGLDEPATAALDPVRAHLQTERERAHEQLTAELRGVPARAVFARWSTWLDHPLSPDADVPPAAHRPLGRFVAKRIARAHDTMIERGRSITTATPAEVLHDLRKDAKKLRYLVECFGGLYEASARKPFVQRLKALQDNLGEHQDAEVHVAQLRDVSATIAATAPLDTVLATGQLVERMEQRRLASRAEFAERFAAFDTPATRRALAALLESERRSERGET